MDLSIPTKKLKKKCADDSQKTTLSSKILDFLEGEGAAEYATVAVGAKNGRNEKEPEGNNCEGSRNTYSRRRRQQSCNL